MVFTTFFLFSRHNSHFSLFFRMYRVQRIVMSKRETDRAICNCNRLVIARKRVAIVYTQRSIMVIFAVCERTK
jgi:hypothetical protein